MEQWERNYYISAIAGANNGSPLVVMSKGTQYVQQSYKVSDSFPFKWINKKWREGFYVTSMATAGSRWAVVISRSAGFSDQVVEVDFPYPNEGIHRRWDHGYRITATTTTWDQAAFVLSVPRRKSADEAQETLRISAFPCQHVKEKFVGNIHLQVTKALLQEVFQSTGPVEGCKLITKEKLIRRRYFSDKLPAPNPWSLMPAQNSVHRSSEISNDEDRSLKIMRQFCSDRSGRSICLAISRASRSIPDFGREGRTTICWPVV